MIKVASAQSKWAISYSKVNWFRGVTCVGIMLLAGCGSTLLSSDPHPPGTSGTSKSAYQTYMLPKALLRVQLRREGEMFTVNISEPIIVGDVKHRYDLVYNESFFASDNFDIEVDDKSGLLTVVNTNTDLQIDEILVAGAGAVGALVTIFELAEPGENEQILVDELVDPTVKSEVDNVVARMNLVYGQAKGRSCALASDRSCIQIRISGEGFDYREPPATASSEPACNVGICYRTVLPFRVSASVVNDSKDAEGHFANTSSTSVVLPDPGSVLHLDTTRPAFVSRQTNVTMVNGIVQKVHTEKPSEAVAVLGTPIRMIEAFFSAVGAVFKAQEGSVAAQTELIKARTAQQEAQNTARRESATQVPAARIPLILRVTNGGSAPVASVLPKTGQGGCAGGAPERQALAWAAARPMMVKRSWWQ